MKGKVIPMLGLAIVFGGVSIYAADALVKSRAKTEKPEVIAQQAPQPAIELKKIVVAKSSLSYGAALNADVLVEIDWPANALPEGAFSSISELTSGQERLLLSPLAANEPILKTKISGENGRATLANLLEPGKRAVTIRVDDISGVAGFVRPGDRVDIVLTRQNNGAAAPVAEGDASAEGEGEAAAAAARSGEYTSEVILESIKVLTADQNLDEGSVSPDVAKAVTIEVSTEQAQKVALAQQVGSLYLLLRPAGDDAAKLPADGVDNAKTAALPGGVPSLDSIIGPAKDEKKFRMLIVRRGHAAKTYTVLEEDHSATGNQ